MIYPKRKAFSLNMLMSGIHEKNAIYNDKEKYEHARNFISKISTGILQ